MSEEYRRHAAECLRIAESVSDTDQRLWLIDMAQCWLHLAQQAEKKGREEIPESNTTEPEASVNSALRRLA
jgi:hypothetical protein